jgi:hypothetical protein
MNLWRGRLIGGTSFTKTARLMALPIDYRITELHAQGKTNKEIAEALGKARHTVLHHLNREGLKFNGPGQTKILKLGDSNARCKKCREVKPLTSEYFHPKRGGTGQKKYLSGICCVCHRQTKRDLRNKNIFSYRIVSLRTAAKRRGLPFDLTEQHLRDLYERQGGRCFYTDREMSMKMINRKTGRFSSLSIDRIFPEEGYVQGNVVLCIMKANTVKNNLTLDEIAEWLPGWYQRIMRFLLER